MKRYEIHFKDIDPDTGNITQTDMLAIAYHFSNANWIKFALENVSGEPNRVFYIVEQKTK